MALFRYFKREKGNLPDPHGPLARSVPSTSIAAANSEVSTAIDTASRNSGKRGYYTGQYLWLCPTTFLPS